MSAINQNKNGRHFTQIVLRFSLVWLLASCTSTPNAQSGPEKVLDEAQGNVTTVYLVRHSEKELEAGKDPTLTEQGTYRANKWVEVLQHVDLDAVYSTNTKRTIETAAPIANSRNLRIIIYNGRDPDLDRFSQGHIGGSILIVGHSNTVPDIVNRLIGRTEFQELSEKDYDDLYVVTLSQDAKHAQRLTIRHVLPQHN